jgi:hypothetical protein
MNNDELIERLDRESHAGWTDGHFGWLAQASAAIRELQAERDALQQQVDALQRTANILPRLDCRYTASGVADTGGIHCLFDAPCARCEKDRQIDALKEKNERLRDAARKAIGRVTPWATHCDYRAEPDLQRAVKVLEAALTGREAGQ